MTPAELYERYAWLIPKVIKRYYRARPDLYDEYVSVGIVGLYHAIRSFRPERGSRFSTYATRCIYTEIGAYGRDCRRHAPRAYSLEAPLKTHFEGKPLRLMDILPADEGDPEQPVCAADDLAELREAVARLRYRERRALEMYYWEGAGQKEIAAAFGCTKQYVSMILLGARRRLKKLLNERSAI